MTNDVKGGFVKIDTDNIGIFQGSEIASATFGSGSSKNIDILARNINIDGYSVRNISNPNTAGIPSIAN